MKTHQLRLAFEILLAIGLAAALMVALGLFVSHSALEDQVLSLQKQAQETELSLHRQRLEMRLAKDLQAKDLQVKDRQDTSKAELDAIKSAFANGVVLKDLETFYKSQKNWSTDRQVGVATLQLLAHGGKDEATIASIQKALDMAELNLQKKCGAQNASLKSTKPVC
jgi:hypothetical protein